MEERTPIEFNTCPHSNLSLSEHTVLTIKRFIHPLLHICKAIIVSWDWTRDDIDPS
jgi:hypothetical protein